MCFILKTHAYFVIVVLLFEIGYHNAAKAYPKFTIYTAQNGFELIILLYPSIECSHDKTVSPPLTRTVSNPRTSISRLQQRGFKSKILK